MKTAAVVNQVEVALRDNLNAQIAIEALEYSKPVAPVSEYSQGFEDPMQLRTYNACLVCPDQVRRDSGSAMAKLQIDIIFAIRGADKIMVMDTMKVYADAMANLVEADPTIGGHVFEARFEAAEFIGPTPANGLVGVVIARLSVDTDDLLQ